MNIFIKTVNTVVSLFLTLIAVSTFFPIQENISTFLNSSEFWSFFVIIVCILIVILQVVTTILQFFMNHTNSKRIHKFKLESEEFYKFFDKWYSKKGTLSIICDDLDWINNSILKKLCKKSQKNKLNLFLSENHNNEKIDILINSGAKIYKAPSNIIGAYSFSCMNNMGNTTDIIVRKKRNDGNGTIVFEEISDEMVSSLLNELILSNRIEVDNE